MAGTAAYAPEFAITLDGETMPAAMRGCVARVSYQDGIEGADRVEMTLANPDLRWLEDPRLAVDTPFRLAMGYAPDPLEEMFVGEITGVEASFPNSGMPTLNVTAHDYLQRLTKGSKDRVFELSLPCFGKFPIPDPDVVSLVSLENQLLPAVDPVGSALSFLTLLLTYATNPVDAQKSIRFQRGQSDFDFLQGIAKDNGWELSIDHTAEPHGFVLRFQFLVQDYTPAVTLRWGQSLNEFTPRLSTVGQVVGITTRIWVASIKLELVITLSWDFDRAAFDIQIAPGSGNSGGGSDKKKSVLKIDAVGPMTAPKKILSELLPRLNSRLTGSGSTIGDLRIRAGKVIAFEGLGEQFSGLYRVTQATHAIDGGGYRTQFEARKEVWFGSVPAPKGAKGLARVQGQRI